MRPAAKARSESTALKVPERPSARKSSAPVSEQYYCWADGREQGPFNVEQLVQRAAEGRLSPEEFVKLGASGTWRPAASVEGVFPDGGDDGSAFDGGMLGAPDTKVLMGDVSTDVSIPDSLPVPLGKTKPKPAGNLPSFTPPDDDAFLDLADLQPPTTERGTVAAAASAPPVAKTAPSRLRAVPVPPELSAAAPSPAPAHPFAPSPSEVVPFTALTEPATPAAVTRPPQPHPRVRRWEDENRERRFSAQALVHIVKSKPLYGAAVLAAVLAVAAAAFLLTTSTSDRQIYDKFMAIWDELKLKRSQHAHSSEWLEFSNRAKKEITPLVEYLDKTASNRERAKQELLWAGEDYLLFMLGDARTQPSESEAKFAQHMQEAERILSGGAPGTGAPPSAVPAAPAANDPEAAPAAPR
jgi:hypothetical protein